MLIHLQNQVCRTRRRLSIAILIEHGALPIQEITKKTKLKRATIYKVLYGLEDKGLVVKFKKNKKIHFKPEHPYKLLEMLQAQTLKYEHGLSNLENSINEITSAYNLTQNQPGVRVFEGIEGVKQVYMDTLNEGKEILAILKPGDFDPTLVRWLDTYYTKNRASRGIHAKVIVAKDRKSEHYLERDKKELRTTAVIPANKFKLGTEVNIYGEKVAFITFPKQKNLIAIIIHNKLVSDTMRALWQLAWDHANEP